MSATFLLVCFVYLNENAFERRKNVFYFTSKALLVLEITLREAIEFQIPAILLKNEARQSKMKMRFSYDG